MDKRKGYVLLLINAGVRNSVSERKKSRRLLNRCTFILMLFMINLTIDLYYYYEYVNMYLVCTYNMARYYFHIVIWSLNNISSFVNFLKF
jgi:preprotein translocase subunit SecG